MAATKPIYVSPHKDGWQIKREKANKALFVFSTKKEAMEKAKEIAINTGCYIVERDAQGKVVTTQTTFTIDIKKMKPVEKPAKKTAAKKSAGSAAKKPAAKKTVAKKPVAKKAAPKKTAAKKAASAAKKPVAKKTVAKKPVAKKPAAKKAAAKPKKKCVKKA